MPPIALPPGAMPPTAKVSAPRPSLQKLLVRYETRHSPPALRNRLQPEAKLPEFLRAIHCCLPPRERASEIHRCDLTPPSSPASADCACAAAARDAPKSLPRHNV